jgi:hypothetical protein
LTIIDFNDIVGSVLLEGILEMVFSIAEEVSEDLQKQVFLDKEKIIFVEATTFWNILNSLKSLADIYGPGMLKLHKKISKKFDYSQYSSFDIVGVSLTPLEMEAIGITCSFNSDLPCVKSFLASIDDQELLAYMEINLEKECE